MARSTPIPPTIGNGGRPIDGPEFEAEGPASTAAQSTTGLLRRLADDLATLLRKELALATSEVSQVVTDTRRGAASIATGGAVLFAGFLFLLLAATAALAERMEPWLAALIVGVVVGIIGYIMLAAGRRKLSAGSKMERTQEVMRDDRDMLRRRQHT